MKFPSIGLPLLAKELAEQAARRRTYIVRVVYACLLFFGGALLFHQILNMRSRSPFAVLGRGVEMFESLVGLQFTGIYVFLPAIACGALTVEKERNSLQLLLLTRLGPWTILFEKFLSRLVPMLSFVLLSLPLLAYAYSLGGITLTYFGSGVWTLAIAIFQIAALAVMCSAYCRTTVHAFVAAYVAEAVMFFGLAMAVEVGLFRSFGVGSRDDIAWCLFAPFVFFEEGRRKFDTVFLHSLPILISTVCFVLLARIFIIQRAFAQPRNLVIRAFKYFDELFWKLNDRYTRGIVLISENTTLPKDEPIAWRETTKKSLGTFRYLFRVLVVAEILVCIMCLLVFAAQSGIEWVSVMVFLLWAIAVLMVSVKSASLIAGERTHQTFDVLATTPLHGREIIKQKIRGVNRLICVLCMPFFTLFVFEAWWKSEFSTLAYAWRHDRFEPTLYLVASCLSVAIYLPMVAWLSLLIGLRVRTQTRAIIGSLAAIVGWCVLPFVIFVIPLEITGAYSQRASIAYISLLSPATIIPYNEFDLYREFAPYPPRTGWAAGWYAVAFNFLFYGFCLFVFRSLCVFHADRHLERAEG